MNVWDNCHKILQNELTMTSGTNLTQNEANFLITMEKHRSDECQYSYPSGGQSLIVPLNSTDKKELFLLDISVSRIDLKKRKYQNRARQIVVLVRLDLGGPAHRNPDDQEISCPHLHVYREGYGHKWAVPIPPDKISRINDLWGTLEDFMIYCNITQPPFIERGLLV